MLDLWILEARSYAFYLVLQAVVSELLPRLALLAGPLGAVAELVPLHQLGEVALHMGLAAASQLDFSRTDEHVLLIFLA